MAAVEYDKVSKSYGNVRVMEAIDLLVADRRFVVLLGPSGCGKTTLLRMTAGLETIGAGEIRIGGRRVNDVHPRDRDIAMVFQNYALYPTMKVFDNIAFSLQVKKAPKAEIEQKVRWAAELLGLTDYLDRYPRALSGGQRQRVAMGRALVRDPKVFLFDEPLSNLDAKLRGQMRYEIRRIHDRLETTTVYVTHDQIEAMTMADEIVVMRSGKIEQIGSPDEIYQRPANVFVADFIGSPPMNFLKGQVESSGDRPAFRFKSLSLPLPKASGLAPGRPLVYGLRPVDLVLAPQGELKGEMVLSENAGSETMIHLGVEGDDLRAVVPGRPHIERGATIAFSVAPVEGASLRSRERAADRMSEARLHSRSSALIDDIVAGRWVNPETGKARLGALRDDRHRRRSGRGGGGPGRRASPRQAACRRLRRADARGDGRAGRSGARLDRDGRKRRARRAACRRGACREAARADAPRRRARRGRLRHDQRPLQIRDRHGRPALLRVRDGAVDERLHLDHRLHHARLRAESLQAGAGAEGRLHRPEGERRRANLSDRRRPRRLPVPADGAGRLAHLAPPARHALHGSALPHPGGGRGGAAVARAGPCPRAISRRSPRCSAC